MDLLKQQMAGQRADVAGNAGYRVPTFRYNYMPYRRNRAMPTQGNAPNPQAEVAASVPNPRNVA